MYVACTNSKMRLIRRHAASSADGRYESVLMVSTYLAGLLAVEALQASCMGVTLLAAKPKVPQHNDIVLDLAQALKTESALEAHWP